MGEDVDAGRLSQEDAGKTRTSETYSAGVMRAFTALASLGAVDDLGDFPPLATVRAGELLDTYREDGDDDMIVRSAIDAVLALPNRATDGTLNRSVLVVSKLHPHLIATVAGYDSIAGDSAGTWHLLADLHDQGLLDVSAAPSRRMVTGLRTNVASLPAGFTASVSGKAARAAAEIAYLVDFFTDSTTCANRKLADYFGIRELPDGCCSHAGNRCSACWQSGDWPVGETKPKVADALETPKPRPAGSRTDSAFAQRRLDDKVYDLVWDIYAGVHILDLQRALRGEDSSWNPKTRRRHRLRTALVNSRYFGSSPSIRREELEDSLHRLQDAGRVAQAGVLWRESQHIARDALKAAAAQPVAPGASR
jgi:ATP-dependent DNA helicase RecQ